MGFAAPQPMLSWRSLGSAVVLAALVVGGMTTACGAPTPLEATEAAPTDPWVVPASKSTRSAIGVHSWGFRTMAGGTLAVRGYDEEHQRLVEIRQRIVETDATHWVLDLAVARSSGTSGVRFLLGARATANGLEVVGDVAADTLGPNAAARRVLDYLRADARLPGAMDPASIKPLDLVGGGGGGPVVGDKEGPITDEKDGGLTGEGGEGSAKDEKCQESSQCGGDMMSSLGPVLGMLGSAGSGLSSFAGIFQCAGAVKSDAGGPAGDATTPEGLYDLAKCAIEQSGQQQQAGQAGQGGQGGQGGGGVETLTQALSAFTSMQQMGQNCNCPQ